MEKGSNYIKNNKILLVIVIVLSILVILETTIIFSTLLVKPSANRNESSKEIVNKEVKDVDIITDLSIKIDSLLSTKTNNFYKYLMTSAYGYRYQVLKQDLTDELKQEILLDNIIWEDMTYSSFTELKDTDFIKELVKSGYSEEYIVTSTKEISLDKVSKFSKTLFGENITSPVRSITKCPIYTYIESTKSYYFPISECGGINPHYVATYKSKFEDHGTEIHIYVSIAHLVSSGTQSILDKYTIYKDFDFKSDPTNNDVLYKNEYKTGLSQQEVENFEITPENYHEFSEYRFIFKQDKNNNYYFVKVEQTK